jgi:predicted lysophospholipase L1 biosynthesis ABC-type transport system permease subunit
MWLFVVSLLRHKWTAWALLVTTSLSFLASALLATSSYLLEVSRSLQGSKAIEVGVAECDVGNYSLALLWSPSSRQLAEDVLGLKAGSAGGLLIDERAAEILGARLGDSISVCNASGTVAGILSYSGGVVVVPGDGGSRRVSVYVGRGALEAVVRGALEEGAAVLVAWLFSLAVLSTAALLAVFLAVFVDAKRYLACFEVLGAGRRHLFTALVVYGLIVGFLGAWIGSSGGLVVTQAAFKVLGSLGLVFELKPFLDPDILVLILVLFSAGSAFSATVVGLWSLMRGGGSARG